MVLLASQGGLVLVLMVVAIVVVMGAFFAFVRGWFPRGSRTDKKLHALGAVLGLATGRHVVQRSYGHPEEVVESIHGRLDGREFRIHYASYASRSGVVLSVLLPRAETWIETRISPGLAIGADVTDVIGIRRGRGPAAFGDMPFMDARLQRVFENRRAAAMRVIALLQHPQFGEIARGLGPHILAASDDTLLLVLLERAEEPAVRRACAVAGRVADALPGARRGLPGTSLDAEVRALAETASAWVRQAEGDQLPFEIGVEQGTFPTLVIDTGVALCGLGTFAPGPGGPLIHRVNHRPAPIPAYLDAQVVVDAVRALPPGVTTLRAGSRLKVIMEAHARRDDVLIAAAFGLAHALRDAALKGTSS